MITDLREKRDKGELFENPITDYFENPLNSLASARGLARGYFLNLVTPCLKGKVIKGPASAKGKSGLRVQTLLPNRLRQATREAVEKVFKQGRIKDIVIGAPGREITAYIWAEHKPGNGDPIVVDIPTTMASLFQNVYARLGRGTMKDPNSPDFRALEDDEINQFVRYLTIFRTRGKSTMRLASCETTTGLLMWPTLWSPISSTKPPAPANISAPVSFSHVVRLSSV